MYVDHIIFLLDSTGLDYWRLRERSYLHIVQITLWAWDSGQMEPFGTMLSHGALKFPFPLPIKMMKLFSISTSH